MSAAVDVRAAIRHAVSALHGAADDGADTRRYADALHEAGKAVAELIAERDALKAEARVHRSAGISAAILVCECEKAKIDPWKDPSAVATLATDRCIAALKAELARVGGGA